MQVGSSTGKESTITMRTADFYLFFLIQNQTLVNIRAILWQVFSVFFFFIISPDYRWKFPVSVPSASLNTTVFLRKNYRNTRFIHLCLKHSRDKNLHIQQTPQQTQHHRESTTWLTCFQDLHPPFSFSQQVGEKVYFSHMIHVRIMRWFRYFVPHQFLN